MILVEEKLLPPFIVFKIKSLSKLPFDSCIIKFSNIFNLYWSTLLISTKPQKSLNSPICPESFITTVGIDNCIDLNVSVDGADITQHDFAINSLSFLLKF